MRTTGRTPLHKANLMWPLTLGAQGLRRVSGVLRYHSALRHLLRTKPGSYYVDPAYGCSFEDLRTQGINPTKMEQAKAQLIFAVARYIPDIQIADVVFDMDHENHILTVKVVWIVRSADPAMHGELARTQETQVSY